MCSGSCENENHIQNLCRHATTTNFREQYRGFSLRNNARLGLKSTVQCLLSMLIALDLSPSTTNIKNTNKQNARDAIYLLPTEFPSLFLTNLDSTYILTTKGVQVHPLDRLKTATVLSWGLVIYTVGNFN